MPELDGVRGLAALVVFGHHLLDAYIPNSAVWNPFVRWTAKTLQWGAYGVDFFFVLSGFLITTILLKDRDQPAFFQNFYWKRALRILPLYFVSLALLSVFSSASKIYVLLCVFFLSNFANMLHQDSSGPYWTLAIEEQFYLLWPYVVRRLSVERLQQAALGLAGTCMLLRLAAAMLGHYNFRFPFFRFDGLALGALLACQHFRRQRGDENRHSRTGRSLILIASVGLLALLPVTFLQLETRPWLIAFAVQVAGINLLGYALIAVCVNYAGSPWLAILRSRVLVFFGAISYCFYMVHAFVILEYDRRHLSLTVNDMRAYFLRIAVVLAVSIAICIISRYVLELPAQRLRQYVLRGRRS